MKTNLIKKTDGGVYVSVVLKVLECINVFYLEQTQFSGWPWKLTPSRILHVCIV